MHNIEAADLREVPKIVRYFGHSMPTIWAMSAHLMVSYRPLNGLLQTTLCAFIPNSGCQSFLLFLVCIDILYILKK